jgi:hypothetical protein
VLSHPSDKNKNVARVGHPDSCWGEKSTPTERGLEGAAVFVGFVVSHPFAKNANGGGTQILG